MIGDYVDRSARTLKVLSPDFKGFENSQEFFVMGVIVQFGRGKCAGVESNRVNFTIRSNQREDRTQSVVRSICFENDL